MGSRTKHIIDEVSQLLDNSDSYRAMAQARNPYGDGHAAQRILQIVEQFLTNDVSP